MGEIIFSYNDLDKSSSLKQTHRLSAVLGADSFFYRISGSVEGESVAYHRFPRSSSPYLQPAAFLETVLTEEDHFFSELEHVLIAFADLPFLVVREAGITTNGLAKLASSAWFAGASDQLVVQPLAAKGQVLVYTVPNRLLEELQLYFGDFDMVHLASCLASDRFGFSWTQQRSGVIEVYTHLNHVILIGQMRGRLLFCRDFPYQSREDILYFLHACAKLAGIDPSNVNVLLSGPGSRRLNQDFFKRYYPHTVLSPEGEQATDFPRRMLRDLASLSVCAS